MAAVCLAATTPAAAVPVYAQNEQGDGALLFRPLAQSWRPLMSATSDPDGRFAPLTPLSTGRAGYPPAPQVELDEQGGAVAAWIEYPAGSFNARALVATKPPGGEFEAPVAVSSPDTSVAELDVAVNARGDAVLVWNDYRGVHYVLRPAGGSFGDAAEVPGPITHDVRAIIEADGGALFIGSDTPSSGGPPAIASFATYRRADGGFDAPHRIEGAPFVPSTAIGSNRRGDVLLAWVEDTTAWMVERPAGGDWGPRRVLAGGLLGDLDFGIALAELNDAGDAVVLLGRDPLLVFSRRGGGDFGAPVAIARYPTPVSLDMNESGAAVLAFAAYGGGARARFLDAGTAPGPERALDGAAPLASGAPAHVAAAIDGRDATVVWERSDGEEVQLRAATLTAGGAASVRTIAAVPTFIQEQPPSACTPVGRPVLKRGARAVVVGGGVANSASACLLARGVQLPLDRTYPFPLGLGSYQDPGAPVALNGPFAASVVHIGSRGGSSPGISVVDLRDERSGLSRSGPALLSGRNAGVPALRLGADGAAAWVACRRSTAAACTRRARRVKLVYAWGVGGVARVVGRGARVDPRSLRVRGGRVVWRNGGRLRRASLTALPRRIGPARGEARPHAQPPAP